MDSHLCCTANKLLAALLMCLSSMLFLELPHVNVITKVCTSLVSLSLRAAERLRADCTRGWLVWGVALCPRDTMSLKMCTSLVSLSLRAAGEAQSRPHGYHESLALRCVVACGNVEPYVQREANMLETTGVVERKPESPETEGKRLHLTARARLAGRSAGALGAGPTHHIGLSCRCRRAPSELAV